MKLPPLSSSASAGGAERKEEEKKPPPERVMIAPLSSLSLSLSAFHFSQLPHFRGGGGDSAKANQHTGGALSRYLEPGYFPIRSGRRPTSSLRSRGGIRRERERVKSCDQFQIGTLGIQSRAGNSKKGGQSEVTSRM